MELKELLSKPVGKDGVRFALDTAIFGSVVPAGRWRMCTDEEHAEAAVVLAKLVGKEARLPRWSRRLAVLLDRREWLLVLDALPPSWEVWHAYSPPVAVTVAVPLESGVAILQSPNSPETELARRRDGHEAYRNAEAEKARIVAEKQAAEAAEKQRVQRERYDFKADRWAQLSPMERFAARLALLAEARGDKALAGDVRVAIASAGDEKDFPRSISWWAGIEQSAGLQAADAREAELAAFARRSKAEGICARIPSQTRLLLGIQHGPNNFEAIAEAWEALESQRQQPPKNARAEG